MSAVGLYIHAPFCVRKCPYCDFYSVTDHNTDLFKSYTAAVTRNIKKYINENSDISFDTVYFGGGTPSLLPVSFYQSVIDAVSDVCDIKAAEITMELNPKTADYDKLLKLRKTGINRLSVGVQSADDTELSYLGRIHSFAEASDIILSASGAGFKNISADLMVGIKGQTDITLAESIDRLTKLPITHLSAYMLKIEKGTAYYQNNIADSLPDEDKTADMYLSMIRHLDDRGFFQYEISNFSKPGFRSRHNLKYWHCQEYIGIGPSAHSYFAGKRYEVPSDISCFIGQELQNEIVNEEVPGDFFETAMLALRLSDGLDMKLYPEYAESVLKKAEKLQHVSLLDIDDNVIKLRPEGFLISNSVISELLSDS